MTTENAARRRRQAVGAVLLAGLLAACQPGADLPPLPSAPAGPYTLDTGDEVRVITFGEQTLTGQFHVDDSGNIAIPLLGPVPAKGATTAQLSARVAALLREKNLFRNPSVSAEIVTYRPIFVLGEVSKPGEFPFQPGMTVLSTVAIAGGFTYRAVQDYASIVRVGPGTATEGRVGRDALVQPGDVITIFERRF